MEFRVTTESNPTYNPEISFIRDCPFCNGATIIFFNTEERERLFDWAMGKAHVQHMFPELSADQREILISGSHSDCFDAAFKEAD